MILPDSISYPLFFLLPILLGVIVNRVFGFRFGSIFVTTFFAFVLYFYLLQTVEVYENEIRQELYEFDLNGDGSFSGAELTEEQNIAMEKLVNDTGRGLAPITLAIFGLIYNFFLIGVIWFFDKKVLARAKKTHNKALNNRTAATQLGD